MISNLIVYRRDDKNRMICKCQLCGLGFWTYGQYEKHFMLAHTESLARAVFKLGRAFLLLRIALTSTLNLKWLFRKRNRKMLKILSYTMLAIVAGFYALGVYVGPQDKTAKKVEPVVEVVKVKPVETRLVKQAVKPLFDIQAAARTCKDAIRRSVKFPLTLTIHWDRQLATKPGLRQVSYGFTSKNAFGVPKKRRMYCNFTIAGKLTKYFVI